MAESKLYNSLAKLGFPLFEPSEEPDVNETLAEVVRSNDPRLWEGFPVLLINAAENYQFSLEKVKDLLDIKEQKENLHQLILLSASIYSLYHLSFPWLTKLKKEFSIQDKNYIKAYRNFLKNNKIGNQERFNFDPERINRLFELYFDSRVEKERRKNERHKEFSLEFALSQIFPAKQKELFKKKLEGLPLNKTEQEYYSRTVKKKVVALANPELHNLSRKLLDQT